jgi:hypothetical protein
MRLRTETFSWPAEVVELARELDHPKRSLLLSVASDSKWGLGNLDEAKGFAQEGVALADDPRFEPWVYIDLAEIAMFEGDVAVGLDVLRTGAAHPADTHRAVLSGLLWFAGHVGAHLPEDEIAAAMVQIKDADFPMAFGIGLGGQAASVAVRDVSAAVDLYQEASDIFESHGCLLFEQRARAELAGLLASSEDPERALGSFVEIVNAWRINGDTMLSAGMAQLTVLLARLGHRDGAVRLYGAVTRGIALDVLVPELEATMSGAREAMGDAAFRAASDAGAVLSYQEAGELACDLITLARAELTPRTQRRRV